MIYFNGTAIRPPSNLLRQRKLCSQLSLGITVVSLLQVGPINTCYKCSPCRSLLARLMVTNISCSCILLYSPELSCYTLVFSCALLYSPVHSCILLCTLVFLCALLCSTVHSCILLCTLVFFYAVLYSSVHSSILPVYSCICWSRCHAECTIPQVH